MTAEKIAQWDNAFAAHEASGVSVKEFCEGRGLSRSRFYHERLRRKRFKDGEAGSGQFVELELPEPPTSNEAEIIVELPFGIVVRFRGVAR